MTRSPRSSLHSDTWMYETTCRSAQPRHLWLFWFSADKRLNCRISHGVVDDCALGRLLLMFMAHYFLTAADPNVICECPMLRCKQKFDNARLMLLHLRCGECRRFEEGEFECPICPERHLYPIADHKDCSWLREKTSSFQNITRVVKAKLTSPRQSRLSPPPLPLELSDMCQPSRSNTHASTKEYPMSPPDAVSFDRSHAYDKYLAHAVTGAQQRPAATAPTTNSDGVCECYTSATSSDGVILTLVCIV